METREELSLFSTLRWFKSYYVVWKRSQTSLQWGELSRLNRTMQYGNCFGGFLLRKKKNCLNRTMQYGNFSLKGKAYTMSQFKSYYVVWKPPEIKLAVATLTGLNRTMQYGNEYLRPRRKRGHYVFKSYYVVWKLYYIILYYYIICLFKSYYVVWKLRPVQN